MNAYSCFYHRLGRFHGRQDLIIIPKRDIPHFIKTDEIILPNQLNEKFKGSDAKGLVSAQVLAILNIYLGGDVELSRGSVTEFLHNLSLQALNRENGNILLHFEKISDLVTAVISLLKQ